MRFECRNPAMQADAVVSLLHRQPAPDAMQADAAMQQRRNDCAHNILSKIVIRHSCQKKRGL
jgi:hypothetical protein